MNDTNRSNRIRTKLLLIMDTECKSSNWSKYFQIKEPTVIEAFKIEFNEYYNKFQENTLSHDSSSSVLKTVENQEHGEGSTCNTNSINNSSIVIKPKNSSQQLLAAKESKGILRAICNSIRSKKPIEVQSIRRRSKPSKTTLVHEKEIEGFKAILLKEGKLHQKKHYHKTSLFFYQENPQETQGNILNL